MTYQEEIKTLSKLCKKCGGKCCIEGGSITISKKELQKLRVKSAFKEGCTKNSQGMIMTIQFLKNESCPFLGKTKINSGTSVCVLKGRARPLGCRLFPLTFLFEKKKTKFYISLFCQYAKDILKLREWIKKSIKDAEIDLETWTAEEKLTRTHIHKKIHKNHKYLIEIKNGP